MKSMLWEQWKLLGLLVILLMVGCSENGAPGNLKPEACAGDTCCDSGNCEFPAAPDAAVTTDGAVVSNDAPDADRPCASGTLACPCSSDGTCDDELQCDEDRELCVDPDCNPGEEACDCLPDDSCNDGLRCATDICLANVTPAETTCYSPCRSDLVIDVDGEQQIFKCGSDGLMARCLGDFECVQGSCIPPDEAPPTCEHELDCADFQTCVQGVCSSECNRNSECGDGLECYRHVCRTPCDGRSSCPDGLACQLIESELGYCLPFREADTGDEHTVVAGRFTVSDDALLFSNRLVRQTITVTNQSSRAVEFRLSKRSHTEFARSGSVVVSKNALPFVLIGAPGEAERDSEYTVAVGAGESADIEIALAEGDGLPDAWHGALELSSGLGTQALSLSYSTGMEGRWLGSFYYFAQFGERNVDAWQAARTAGDGDATALQQVGNALLQKWNLFKSGRSSLAEFTAVVTATTSGSWQWPSVQQACRDELPGTEACYLFDDPNSDNDTGVRAFSDSLEDQPVPSGMVELPIALDLLRGDAPTQLLGRIASEESLQYAGNPAVELELATEPTCAAGESACIVPVKAMRANAVVGGRYWTDPSDRSCEQTSGFEQVAVPWLVPGFARYTATDDDQTYRYECRDPRRPIAGDGSNGLNLSLAQANPIPDGRSRQRQLTLLDGILINQSEMLLLVRETLDGGFLGNDAASSHSAYGLIVLRRSRAQLNDGDFEGTEQSIDSTNGGLEWSAELACPNDLVSAALGIEQAVSAENVDALVTTLLSGVRSGDTENQTQPYATDRVHYLCVDTGIFDDANCADPVFFALADADDASELTEHSCQGEVGECAELISDWEGRGLVELDLVWNCPDAAACGLEDSRSGKLFYPRQGTAAFLPLNYEVDEAFVYKTRFRNREGGGLGFAPVICDDNRSITPYCYDPGRIEEAEERVNCLVYAHTNFHAALQPKTQDQLKAYLEKNFSYSQVTDPSLALPVIEDGFERLYADLMILLGEEAYTRAFQARFDLANSLAASFEGPAFEPKGSKMAGVAGYEMFVLYQATQYYQMALDRFFRLSPFLWASLEGQQSDSFIQLETIVGYLDRVLRASAQKSKAWGEVGRRYQRLGRPDLARSVVERAYAGTYLESVVLGQFLRRAGEVLGPEQRDQVRVSLERAQLTYGAALLDMRDVYAAFGDELNTFGFTEDYIPFPALEANDSNAFLKQLASAEEALAQAALSESTAVQSTRTLNTDQAHFDSQLSGIRRDAETQLEQICGVFMGEDGRQHPATPEFAELDERGRVLGDLCGLVGNGSIHEATLQLELEQIEAQGVLNAIGDQQAKVEIELERTRQQCDLAYEAADVQFQSAQHVSSLAEEISGLQDTQAVLEQTFANAQQALKFAVCTMIVGVAAGGDCPSALTAGAAFKLLAYEFVGGLVSFNDVIRDKESEIRAIEASTARFLGRQACDHAQVNAAASIKELTLQFKNLELEAFKAAKRIELALSHIVQLRNQARRVQLEQRELQAQVIQIEAARNDPNVRLYKNSDVANAERSFYRALQEAYKATKVFEYYTSQSYAHRGDLYLVRLVRLGDMTLAQYLEELEQAYRDFGETVGTPEARLDVLSLRDDILGIPRVDDAGRTLSQASRTALFRQALTTSRALNNQGYWTTAFSTTASRLSPVTRNHKLDVVQAEFVGSNVGDAQGRVYLVPSGTSTVQTLDDEALYFRLPTRTAVINTFFNGTRPSNAAVYSNAQLRDRPYLNTHWKLFINQRSELANQDIDLNSLSDVRLYLYYSDVAAPGAL